MLFEKLLKKVFVAAQFSFANSVGGEELALHSPDQSDQISDMLPRALKEDAGTGDDVFANLKYDQQARDRQNFFHVFRPGCAFRGNL